MNRRNVINICIAASISILFVLLAILVFYKSYLRIGESFRDLGLSVAYYFCRIFGIESDISPTVTEYSGVLGVPAIALPESSEEFTGTVSSYFSLIFSKENLLAYFKKVGTILFNFSQWVVIILPALLLLCILIVWLYKRENTNHNTDTLPLRVFKCIAKYTYQPIKAQYISFREFLDTYGWIWKCWIAVWVCNLNFATIGIEFFAYYFYFVVSFDFSDLWVQICKLVVDLQVLFTHFPWWSILAGAYVLFNRWRKEIALNRLRHYEARDCGFINELPIVFMSCGSMGKKKTTLITDMVLSQEVMFRQKALEILQQNDMKFPHFPWIAFEDELKACMEHGTVYNLASVKEWAGLKRRRFARHHNAAWQLYGYDLQRYGDTFDDAQKVSGLFDVLETYALSYFIYVMQSSLIMSNYSIRTDNALIDCGNFPRWLTDFFADNGRRDSRHAHILDFDVLRLGKKVMENNPKAGSFEFGVVAITEIGKERGNNLELKEVKRNTYDTNQKNDLFNSWLKMCRHSATVDNFPFIKVFTDEQRPESWGADARDLADILYVDSCGDMRLALPFYTIEGMISEWAFDRFMRLYTDFRFRRGDNMLLVHILKSVTAWLWRRNLRIWNRYGYSVLKIEKERGTMDGRRERKKYYLMNAKIYAKRFSTDCFSDYFNELARNSFTGLAEYMEYAAEKASVEELKAQNSYFINSLYSM